MTHASNPGSILCQLGFHKWQRTNGSGIAIAGSSRVRFTFDKDCKRCGKHELGEMLI